VGFAVVLLSPDDIGASLQEPAKLRPRARQNVILELGFFLGKLGRNNVLALYRHEGDFELPSDYQGVLWTPYDAGWRLKLVQELRSSGYNTDANRLLNR
jgi:predicted nucleotide-binding protein